MKELKGAIIVLSARVALTVDLDVIDWKQGQFEISTIHGCQLESAEQELYEIGGNLEAIDQTGKRLSGWFKEQEAHK